MFRLVAMLALALSASGETLRVMTFNVRYPAKDDGPDAWEKRRDLLVAAVRSKDPDIVGTQELFHAQGEYLAAKAPEYAWFGLSRLGSKEDEHMGIFYKPSRLKVLRSGNFWLSETPDVPGSVSWGATLPRMVTWALFELLSTRQRFVLYNTHFQHRREDEDARRRSAQLIVDRLSKLDEAIPFLLTGDFNAPATGPVHKLFEGAGLKDAWTSAPKRSGPEGTFHGFKGAATGPRIDWILYRGGWRPAATETVTPRPGDRFPSDHFPVFAVLDLPRE